MLCVCVYVCVCVYLVDYVWSNSCAMQNIKIIVGLSFIDWVFYVACICFLIAMPDVHAVALAVCARRIYNTRAPMAIAHGLPPVWTEYIVQQLDKYGCARLDRLNRPALEEHLQQLTESGKGYLSTIGVIVIDINAPMTNTVLNRDNRWLNILHAIAQFLHNDDQQTRQSQPGLFFKVIDTCLFNPDEEASAHVDMQSLSLSLSSLFVPLVALFISSGRIHSDACAYVCMKAQVNVLHSDHGV